MPRKINISGTILGAEWSALFRAFGLDKDPCYTLEDKFIDELDEAEKAGEPVEVHVNSWGGEVYAARNMLDRFQHFAGEKTVTVGAKAMSAAADFVLHCGTPVDMNRSGILMFHSATTFADGGPGALRDEADMLDAINSTMKESLIGHGIPAAAVERAFQDGRMLSLTAEQAAGYGIVSALADRDEADPEKPDPAQLEKTPEESISLLPKNAAERFGRLCALDDGASEAVTIEAEAEDAQEAAQDAQEEAPAPETEETPAEPEPPAQEAESEPEAPAPEAEPAEPAPEPEEAPEEKPADPPPAEEPAPADPEPEAEPAPAPEKKSPEDIIAKIQSSAAKKINAVRAECAAAIAAKDAELDGLRAELSNLTKQLEDCAASLEAAKSAHDQLVGNVLTGDSDKPKTWRQAVKELGLTKALMKYPDLAAQYRAAHGRK